ncbi:CAF17-like 4Fe-4S cluster assembly/insertion protein YgfZ [Noviherbaspirillum aridicola]|uniref:Folate-binding protein YgfZ n=1 Tax=Noviherbaspirillum aridicola TaxID=2849687 RepID=A0ABQ4QA73_9BURK|nr:folate-binding protein [Noviherbaspirillum aridicola]GIZ54132.1 folate-binding protein YgfZ [Noviherbaspirillum aridicola]
MTESTNAWLQFLAQSGASFDQERPHEVTGFGDLPGIPRNVVSPLTDLGLIGATGDDAANFLHNQLTNDVEHLDMGSARLAGYCSPKGRMLASFLMWRGSEGFFLQLPRAIQPAVQKRLQMFILRAKAKLADRGDELPTLGLAGESVGDLLKKWFPSLPAQPWQKSDSEAGTLIRVPDADGLPRYRWTAPVAILVQAWPELVTLATPAATALWRLLDIRAGLPQVTQATQEQFVPQMVNYELIGGVNFKKGCYPGQEIVARSQYLGKLKRRMMLASVDSLDARAGMEVFSSEDPDQPCGMIVNAEPNFSHGCDCLVELKTAAAEAGSVHLGAAGGPVLAFRALPYPLPA